ncbi:MAG: hypothetical protein QOG19_3361 [Mycobacterium sp.]|jgi:hypothetical protein|nr:hypothetical protein [Mycobacterium sp.]
MACCVAIAYLFGLILRPVRKWFGGKSDSRALKTATFGDRQRRQEVSRAGADIAAQ